MPQPFVPHQVFASGPLTETKSTDFEKFENIMSNMISDFKKYESAVEKLVDGLFKLRNIHLLKLYEKFMEGIRGLEELFEEYKNVP